MVSLLFEHSIGKIVTMSLTMNENQPSIETLTEKLSRANRELTVLYEISNAMRTTLDLDHILYIILTCVTVHTGLGFNRAVLFLVNHKERCLDPQMAIGPESGEHAQKVWEYIASSTQKLEDLIKEEKVAQNISHSSLLKSMKGLKIPLETDGGNLLAKAYHQGIAVHIPREKIDQYTGDILLQWFRTNELVIMPLKAKNKVNGLIIADNLYTQKTITEDDLRMFTMLANQAGLAIENSHLYEMVRHKSRTDSITNLWNHGFFQDQLSAEIDRLHNPNFPISLVMMDIDDFKKLNDTQGHHYGDTVLKEIANILKDSSRENDYACRYGGEEFAIILTQTSKEQALVIAERIRKRIADHALPASSQEHAIKTSVSVGIATFPHDASSKEDLIAKADKAMYIAKFSGKNQTVGI